MVRFFKDLLDWTFWKDLTQCEGVCTVFFQERVKRLLDNELDVLPLVVVHTTLALTSANILVRRLLKIEY